MTQKSLRRSSRDGLDYRLEVDQAASSPQRSAMLQNFGDVMLLDTEDMAPIYKRWRDQILIHGLEIRLKSIDENQVCNLVDLPNGARPIECKRVFKKKTARWKCIHLQGLARCKGVLYVSDKFRESTTRDFLSGSNA